MISNRKSDATWMLALADSALPDSDDTFIAFKQARQSFMDAKSYPEICATNKKMDDAAFWLRGRACAVINNTDKAAYDKIYNEFLDLGKQIENHPYNREANKFNDLLGRFPANTVALLTPLDPLPPFTDQPTK
jgi:hypothetical protein